MAVSTAEAGCLLVLTPSQGEFLLDRIIQMAQLEPINTCRRPGIFLKAGSGQQPVVPELTLGGGLTSQDSWTRHCRARWPPSCSCWGTVCRVPAPLALAYRRCSAPADRVPVSQGTHLPEVTN